MSTCSELKTQGEALLAQAEQSLNQYLIAGATKEAA